MNSTSTRIKLLAILAVGVLALFVLDRLFFTPMLNGWRAREDEIATLEAELARAATLLDQETRWQERRDAMRAYRLPAADDAAQQLLLGRLDAWARNAGLRLATVRPRWQGEDADRRLNIQVTGDGGMRQVVDFVHAVETAELAVAVTQLNLNTSRRGDGVLNLELRLSALCREEAR